MLTAQCSLHSIKENALSAYGEWESEYHATFWHEIKFQSSLTNGEHDAAVYSEVGCERCSRTNSDAEVVSVEEARHVFRFVAAGREAAGSAIQSERTYLHSE